MRLDRSVDFAPDLSVDALNTRYEGAPAQDILHAGLRFWAGGVALVSSFGADAAVLLHMTSQINPHVPVLFIDTAMLFPQTLEYQTALAAELGLTDVRRIGLGRETLRARDPMGALHLTDTDSCCRMRKVEPLEETLNLFSAHVSGRKRFQSTVRANMKVFETDAAGRVRISPLAGWSAADLAKHRDRHDLPAHPLVERGYPSIGCVPCTSRVAPGEDLRAGRWRGQNKTECGIHLGAGRAERIPS